MFDVKMKSIFFSMVIASIISLNNAWIIHFNKDNYTVFMDDEIIVPFGLEGDFEFTGQVSLEIWPQDENVVVFDNKSSPKLNLDEISVQNGKANSSFPIRGHFLGVTRLIFTLRQSQDGYSKELDPLPVKVVRKQRTIDKVFTGSVIILVTLIYINFGCALDWGSLKPILRRPIGPIIGFFGQFGFMPALAYVIGLLVFPQYPEMRLGLLFTGVSPAGGASNVWTVILDGNIDLSVTMTTISTLAAFAMIPLWLFTLGPHVFEKARLEVPYAHIGSLAASLIIPLGIGWLIQRFLPRLSKILVRILKGFSALLILFIVIFAIATNLYLFRLATWRIAIGGLLLPWCGYVVGGAVAWLFKQPARDITAIAIETGIQNTGIAIFLLRLSLPQPEGDLTTIVPVAIAVMTPIPLTLLYIYKRCCSKKKNSLNIVETAELTS